MQSPSNNRNRGSEELNGIQRQINQTTDASLASTGRMLDLAIKTQEIGVNTVVMLDEQSEKLNEIERRLDNFPGRMKKVEKNLTNLQKFAGVCVLPWQRVRHKRRPLKKSSKTTSSEKSSPTSTEPKLRMAGAEGMPTSGYITRITNDDREVQMDDNLQLVSSYLGNLKNIALDMGDTITNHNQQIDRIADKTEDGIERVKFADKRAQKILRRS